MASSIRGWNPWTSAQFTQFKQQCDTASSHFQLSSGISYGTDGRVRNIFYNQREVMRGLEALSKAVLTLGERLNVQG